MWAFDTASIIHAWDNYPIENFPKLWDWLKSEINSNKIGFPEVVKEEVLKNSTECSKLLKGCPNCFLKVTNAISQEALKYRDMLEIVEDRYGAGVSENDLIIISTARFHGCILVTDEKNSPIFLKRRKTIKFQLFVHWRKSKSCAKASLNFCEKAIRFFKQIIKSSFPNKK